jgi:hypothetical protein
VRIGSIRSESHVTDDANGGRTASADLQVSGVTVAGLPAEITEDGLILGSPSGALGPLLRQLQVQVNELLRSLGLTVALLETTEDTDVDGNAVASADGLLISFAHEIAGLPAIPGPLGEIDPNGLLTASVQLGTTAARGAAFAFDPDAPPEDSGVIGDVDFGSTTDGFDVALPDLPDAVPGNVAPSSPPALDTSRPTRSVADLFDDRLGLLYLAMCFAALGLCIVPRLTVPARLPGQGE